MFGGENEVQSAISIMVLKETENTSTVLPHAF